MKNELRNLIRELSEMYDISSKDTYISVYLNKNTDKTFLEKRMNVCKSLLDKDEQKNFIETIEEINELKKIYRIILQYLHPILIISLHLFHYILK